MTAPVAEATRLVALRFSERDNVNAFIGDGGRLWQGPP